MTSSNHQTLIEKIKRLIFESEDCLFEKRYPLEISGVIQNDELEAENKFSLERATAYHAVWCRSLRELFFEEKKTEVPFDAFVNIGAGKGKACFYAHLKMPAMTILGVEFSGLLVSVSNKKKQRFNTSNLHFINAEASNYVLPYITSLVFMFNPFDKVVLERFLANNWDNFRQRRSSIAYANDIHRESLTRLGFDTSFRNPARHLSLYQIGGTGLAGH